MAFSTATSAGAVASRPALRQQAKLSRSVQQRGRQSVTARAVATYSPEQLAFLERKKAEAASGGYSYSAPAAAPTPAPAAQSGGWGSAPAAPAAPAPSSWDRGTPAAAPAAPAAGAAPPAAAGGYSPEQIAFMERKKAEAAGGGWSAPAPAAPAAPAASGWGASAPAAPAAPAAPPAAAGGYSPEQLAFLERKKAEAAGGGWSAPAPAPAAPAAPAASGWGAPAPAAPAAPAAPPAAAGGFSPEQIAFMERKKAEAAGGGWSAPAPAPAAPAAPASSGWGSSPAPAAPSSGGWDRGTSAAPSAPAAAPAAAGGYSPEQLAFLERKKSEKKGLGGTTVDNTGVEAADLKVIHAPLSFFAPDKLELKGPRKNVDWGNPHDYGRPLVKRGSTSVGSWACSEGGWDSPTPRPTTEIFYVFSGQGSVSDPDGTKYPFGPGDVVILPRGWHGRWDISEHIHKVWIIHDHDDVRGAPTSPVVASAVSLENQATGDLSSDVYITSHKMFDSGITSVGFWSRGPGTFNSTKAKTECFYVLDGFFYLNNPDGSCQRCVAGDTIMLPKGWSGTWDIIETVKKVWVYTE